MFFFFSLSLSFPVYKFITKGGVIKSPQIWETTVFNKLVVCIFDSLSDGIPASPWQLCSKCILLHWSKVCVCHGFCSLRRSFKHSVAWWLWEQLKHAGAKVLSLQFGRYDSANVSIQFVPTEWNFSHQFVAYTQINALLNWDFNA